MRVVVFEIPRVSLYPAVPPLLLPPCPWCLFLASRATIRCLVTISPTHRAVFLKRLRVLTLIAVAFGTNAGLVGVVSAFARSSAVSSAMARTVATMAFGVVLVAYVAKVHLIHVLVALLLDVRFNLEFHVVVRLDSREVEFEMLLELTFAHLHEDAGLDVFLEWCLTSSALLAVVYLHTRFPFADS